VHARRTQILPEEHRPKVFSVKTPQSVPTFAVDGQVAGIWKYAKGRIRLEPFAKLARAVRAELEDEAERLAAFHA
jgi:winged helix DNA-binding protein